MHFYLKVLVELNCHLSVKASKGVEVARATGVINATRLMADNHYGWFLRVEKGIYDLTDTGRSALEAG